MSLEATASLNIIPASAFYQEQEAWERQSVVPSRPARLIIIETNTGEGVSPVELQKGGDGGGEYSLIAKVVRKIHLLIFHVQATRRFTGTCPRQLL